MKKNNVLVIRHLPSNMSEDDKKDFLCHFGARNVCIMHTVGPMKHTAFAEFKDDEFAYQALIRLHQLEIAGSRLVVEFAKYPRVKYKKGLDLKPECQASAKETEQEGVLNYFKHDSLQKLGLNFSQNPLLHYLYPPLNVPILENITNALTSQPKFYVQVLHLMNKLNLPAPFGPLHPTPPITPILAENNLLETNENEVRNQEMSISSTESEIESCSEMEHTTPEKQPSAKRQFEQSRKNVKKIKLISDTFQAGKTAPVQQPTWKPNEVFEQTNATASHTKKIDMKLPSNIKPKNVNNKIMSFSVEKDDCTVKRSGFGKFEPNEKLQEQLEETEGISDEGSNRYITLKELRMGRLSQNQQKEMPVFRNYNRGNTSCRLYVKNLAKQVTEKDLQYIYGRYINMELENHRNIFDIRLMKEGRMKGQAFVTLPTEQIATEALEDTNGYVLMGKPIVCQFARSAKAKEKADAGDETITYFN